MLKVGLTGNIGSGKTMVAGVFKTFGIPVFDADFEAKILLNSESIKSRLLEDFGPGIFLNNEIDRKKLAGIVFNDKESLKKLNAIVHPAVRDRFLIWLGEIPQKPYLIYEAAIIFESGYHQNLDYNIMISANEETRINRVMQRDNATREMVLSRMKNQWPQAQKSKMADFIISNENSELLIPQILKIHHELIALGGHV
jgi:dephospho-CoA kinase